MKQKQAYLLALVASFLASHLLHTHAAEQNTFQVVEFAVIRWDGRENTYVIRPNGKVEKLGPLFQRVPRPEGIDERTYYLAIAINAIAKEGYDFAGMTHDQIVLRRSLAR